MDASQCMLQQRLLCSSKPFSVGVIQADIGLGSYLSGGLHEASIRHGGLTVLVFNDTMCRLQTRLLCSGWTLCCASPGPISSKTLCSSHTMRHCMRV